MVYMTRGVINSIGNSDKAGMQLFKEDGGIDMYLTAMRLGWSQVASSLRIDMWSLECVTLLHGLAPLIFITEKDLTLVGISRDY